VDAVRPEFGWAAVLERQKVVVMNLSISFHPAEGAPEMVWACIFAWVGWAALFAGIDPKFAYPILNFFRIVIV
jgi:hypothetical protein